MLKFLTLVTALTISFSATAEEVDNLSRWQNARYLIDQDLKRVDRCITSVQPCTSEVRRFIAVVSQVRERMDAGEHFLLAVNYVVNFTVDQRADMKIFDHWRGPLETLRRGSGDCEDLVILKRTLLQSLGVSVSKLWAVVGDVTYRGETGGHMVLTYITDDQRLLVLDNLTNDIFDIDGRKDFKAIYRLE